MEVRDHGLHVTKGWSLSQRASHSNIYSFIISAEIFPTLIVRNKVSFC